MDNKEIENKIEGMIKELENLKIEIENKDKKEEMKRIKMCFYYLARLQMNITYELTNNIVDKYKFTKIITDETREKIEDAQDKISEIVEDIIDEKLIADIQRDNDFPRIVDLADSDFIYISKMAQAVEEDRL